MARLRTLLPTSFHHALKNLDRFEWRGVPFAAWLFRIATNAIANRGKRAARFETTKLDDIAEQERSNPTDLEEIEHRARPFTMVDKLPADQLQVITMLFGPRRRVSPTTAIVLSDALKETLADVAAGG